MRIVYDDEHQLDFVKRFESFMRMMHVRHYLREEWGSQRIQCNILKQAFADYVSDEFSIGDTVTHANGIGNNCAYPVYYTKNPSELQQVATFNLNSGLYGEAFIYVTDFNGKTISTSYEISKWGIK